MNLLFENDRPAACPESWYAATATPLPQFQALEGEVRADVAIVGGGYTGLSAALHLAEAGVNVVLLEAHRVGFGASGRNGGQVGTGQRVGQRTLERMVGQADARRLWEIAQAAKAKVWSLIDRYGINADRRDGIVYADWRTGSLGEIREEIDHLANTYGYTQIDLLDRAALRDLVAAPGYMAGAVDWGAGHIHPLRFAIGLAAAAGAAGAQIFEQSHVKDIAFTDPAVLTLDRGRIRADHVILACNGYLGDLAPAVAQRVMPINNFIVATEPLADPEAVIAKGVAVADSRFVVNYYRMSSDGRLLFGGGESYGYRFPKDIAALVRRPMRQTFPQLADTRIEYAWGGTLAITRPRFPFFVRPAPNVVSASGYSGHGVALATLAGEILADAIRGQSERFDVMARVPVPAFPGGQSLRGSLLALAMTWYALRDRIGI